jgi:phosphocarrier protein HPr
MVNKQVTITNKLGMHARAAAKFVNLATSFASNIELEKGDRRVNGKSIMGVMMLAASKGSSVTLYANGRDEDEAINRLEQLITGRFGEKE